MTVRQEVASQFEADWAGIPDLAAVWVVASQKEVPVDSRVTAIFSQRGIGTFASAPLSHRVVTLTLEVVSPLTDLDAGADQLEDIVPTVLDYIDPRFVHGAAEGFAYTETQFGYRIPIDIIVTKA